MNRLHPLAVFAAALLASPTASRAASPAITGIPNFHQVTERMYRGGQPADHSWSELSKLGVKTVIDLRRPIEHSVSAESLAVCAAGMRYVNFPMNGFDTPTASQMETLLPLLDGADPVFVHCKKGRDRTGSVIAAYRIARQSWENPKALAEANRLGMAWYENGMRKFIADYRPAPAAPSEPTSRAIADVVPVGVTGTSESDSLQSE